MKAICSFILAFVLVFTLAACQVTPEEPIVVQKDTERMVEKAGEEPGGTAISDLGVPLDRYTFDSTGANGKLTIHADAPVTLPDTETMPIVRASVSLFTQEQVTGMFNYLFPDEKPVNNSQTETKASIEEEIIRMKKQLSENDYGDLTTDQFQKIIEQLEAAYQTAPDDDQGSQVSDGTMRLSFDSQTQEPLFWSLSVATSSAQFSASVPADITKIGSSESGAFVSGASISYRRTDVDYSTRNMVSTDGTTIPDDANGKLQISYSEATSLCETFFASAGMPSTFCVGAAFIIDDTGADESKGENYAYRLDYTRQAEGIPLYFEPTSTSSNLDEAFSVPWEYETIQFIVDNDGIASVVWRNPITIGDAIQQNASLKPFEEISGVFQTMMNTSYEAIVETIFNNQCELDISATDVRLCLMRVREQNAAQTDGLLVPAWVFYGHNKGTNQDGKVRYFQGATSINNSADSVSADRFESSSGQVDLFTAFRGVRESEPVVLLAINAVDGSIIDSSKGY
jgi:hypothetical protein